MHRERRAKIVATLGPASSSIEAIRAPYHTGADVFRFKFSHGSHADHQAGYRAVRAVEQETRRPIAVLVDLQGPKLRVGTFADGRTRLRTGERFRLDLDSRLGDAKRAQVPHPEVFRALAPGVELLLDDGKIRLAVESCGQDHADTRVVVDGALSDRKGVSVVGAVLPLSALTEKDRKDLLFALEMGADWVALSFVQRPEDIEEVRRLVDGRAPVMAKLEKPAAIYYLGSIVGVADGIMVARGDLGVEMPPVKVPVIQRRVLRACRKAGKPSIVATQMLESTITTRTPTRAEASDVATAIYEGSDAVMLSAESASGQYPVESVGMMDRIIREVERDPQYRLLIDAAHPNPEPNLPDAICCALRNAAGLPKVSAAVTYTTSGYTSLRAARERPAAPIISMSPNASVARRLALVWGVHSLRIDLLDTLDAVTARACQAARAEGFADRGDVIAITAGTPFGAAGTANLLKLATV
ncbi:MAG: pyruvate kinase [Acetobacteraceae bacterium]